MARSSRSTVGFLAVDHSPMTTFFSAANSVSSKVGNLTESLII